MWDGGSNICFLVSLLVFEKQGKIAIGRTLSHRMTCGVHEVPIIIPLHFLAAITRRGML